MNRGIVVGVIFVILALIAMVAVLVIFAALLLPDILKALDEAEEWMKKRKRQRSKIKCQKRARF